MAKVTDLHRARAVELASTLTCWGIDATKMPVSVGHIDLDLMAQALADAEARGAEPWEKVAKYLSETTYSLEPSDHGKGGWSLDVTDGDKPTHFVKGAAGRTATEAARDLCSKLGLKGGTCG